jgi:uncharacterized protein (TIGR03546 family)
MFRAILMLDDTPHSIALGTAIGLFIAWTPTVGIHMILVVALSLLFRANKVAALIAVYISNPFTIVPMYWIDYRLGALVLDERVTRDEFEAILNYHTWAEWWQAFWRVCIDLAVPMWIGGVVLALLHAVPGYYLTRWAALRFRRRAAAVPQTPADAIASPDFDSLPTQQPPSR